MSNGTDMNFPHARTADLVVERVGDELVVYDGESKEAQIWPPSPAGRCTRRSTCPQLNRRSRSLKIAA